MEVPGHFTFEKDDRGDFQFGLVQGEMDCRVETGDRGSRIEFSWEGQDEMDPASGRGWAGIENGELSGRIIIHMGERIRRSAPGRRERGSPMNEYHYCEFEVKECSIF